MINPTKVDVQIKDGNVDLAHFALGREHDDLVLRKTR